MIRTVVFAALLIAGVDGKAPGWFGSVPEVRGGAIFGLNHKDIYPDAVANVIHGYAHLGDEVDGNEGLNEIVEVSSTTKKSVNDSDEDYDEDPFFRVLLHNNDDDSSVVNVASTASDKRVDNALFEKLHKKVFPHHEEREHKTEEKISYGLREFLEDSALME